MIIISSKIVSTCEGISIVMSLCNMNQKANDADYKQANRPQNQVENKKSKYTQWCQKFYNKK